MTPANTAQSIESVKADLAAFLSKYREMRNAQIREGGAQGDMRIPLREYNNLFYYRYLAEKAADDLFIEFEKTYLV